MVSQAQAGRCSLADGEPLVQLRSRQVGWDGDLTVVDLNTTAPVRNEDMVSKCGWSPFRNWQLVGWPVATVVAGVVGYERGVLAKYGAGMV